MLTWRDEYSVGVDILDKQHQMLFEIGNRAIKIIQDDLLSHCYEDIMVIFEELKNYTIFHFKTEEEYMIQINYKMALYYQCFLFLNQNQSN